MAAWGDVISGAVVRFSPRKGHTSGLKPKLRRVMRPKAKALGYLSVMGEERVLALRAGSRFLVLLEMTDRKATATEVQRRRKRKKQIPAG